MFGSSYEKRVLLDSAVGNNTCTSTSNPISSSQISDKRKEKIGNPSTSKTKELQRIIHKKVTKKTHSNESPKEGDGTIKKCIELFNNGADPNVLIQLEKLLREQEEYQKYYNYYTEKFLPALKTKVIESEELMKPSVLNNEKKSSQRSPTIKGEILGIISGITNKSSDKNHSSSTIQNQKSHQTDRQDNAMGLFKKKSFPSEVAVAESSDSSALDRYSLTKGVSGTGTPGTYNPLGSLDHYDASTVLISKQPQARKEIAQSQLNGFSSQFCEDLENKNPSTTADPVEVPRDTNTSKLISDNNSDSGINSSGLALSSRRSSLTSISSEESVHLKLNPAEEDNGLQPEDEEKTKLAHPNKTRPKGPSGRRSPSKYYKKTEEGPHCVISVTGSKVKYTMQSNNYENNSKIKNKNLHVALVTSSALLAIGFIVAGAMTSGLVGVGLFVVAAVFATAAAAELCSNILSSKLTSISVSPLVDNKALAV
ncbi:MULTISPECIES: DUF350 domain-containing protein [Wolbachia]|uniref:DUF350 domain-containing protein n=1 Tax=Wolbachia TaxID=953 RepID=UPI00024041F2|nr:MULTISPECIES: DUF350 domain-containing protein [Wolbachia]UYC23261.1 DUF350 domain-containing protein [Wolbachia endosymbiont of Aedes aegypti]QBB83547.1 DUF350 domain-containing protein [Wolbachia pipientis wAlbB]QDW08353.1 DUF350 domain-containing protein [Wolbachia pipientis]QDW09542.1 DUF350 domain-containing protein [Wolbachia pipientis]QZA83738.1 DUF350 domain-containing protein [Wolbachia pipientis]